MTQSTFERFNIGDLVELKSGGPKMTVGQPVTKEAQELRPTATSITPELVVAYHAQIHAMIATSSDPEQAALQLARAFLLPAEEFARAIKGNPEQGLSNGGPAGEVVYCEWFARETRKHNFFSAGELKTAQEEKK